MHFQATISFLNRDQDCIIHFLADDRPSAIMSAWRWAHNRRRAIPEIFGEVGSIKVRTVNPQKIGENGQLSTWLSSPIYEWKRGEHEDVPFQS